MKTKYLISTFILIGALLLSGCGSAARVGALQNESQSVKLGDAKSVRVDINFGAGTLEVTGGAENLLDADFTYNVAKLKPEVEYTDGTLVVRQPEVNGLPAVLGITDFRNEWGLHLDNEVPMDLSVDVGAGTSNLKLGSLSLSGLKITLGATQGTIDLSGNWPHDLDVTIDAGASDLNLLLPSDVGVRVEVDRGPTVIEAPEMTQNGNVYTNAAYGESGVTLRISLSAGVGLINLAIKEAAAAPE